MGFFSRSDTTNKGEITVDCGDILDISKVAEFHQQLMAALGKGGEVILDAAELTRIDATSLQLCTAFFHDAAARKVTAKWRSPSDSLIKSAGLLGLSHQLGLPDIS
jgi:anti-anti-sigma regulatory factor